MCMLKRVEDDQTYKGRGRELTPSKEAGAALNGMITSSNWKPFVRAEPNYRQRIQGKVFDSKWLLAQIVRRTL